ncbi:MAG: Ldh family oxidoreductase [Spirochaetaceae bacterium]|nr:MAG: Ldh family oxidoreductase [Spirochaetaceae bacterium]
MIRILTYSTYKVKRRNIKMASVPVFRYKRHVLIKFCAEYLLALGATDEEASIVADGIVTAASRWHPGKGQGLEKLFRLTIQTSNGGIYNGAEFEVLKDTPAVSHVDGHKGYGYVIAAKAMNMAIEKAKKVGIGAVSVRHSNHYGQAGFHAETATKAGMIGIVMSNARAELAPWGAKTPVVGTNPWGLGIPRDNGFPILLDLALSMSGEGMVRWAYREGVSIPDNYVLTKEGNRSTDPADFIRETPNGLVFQGTQMPIGEFKGFGLAFFTDVLSGVLSGSLFGTEVFQDISNHDVGHFVMAINPDIFMPHDEFQQRLEQLVQMFYAAEPTDPDSKLFLPGELEFITERENEKIGIPIDTTTVENLRRLAEERGIQCPL